MTYTKNLNLANSISSDAVKKIVTVATVLAVLLSATVFMFNATEARALNGSIGSSRLGELIVLSNLFGTSGTSGTLGSLENTGGLGELLVLDGLFGNSNGGIFGSNGSSSLGELIVLNGLFGNSQTVTVQSGDTLSSIAASTLGDASLYPEIASANNISNPNLIYPGQVLKIPSSSGLNGVSGLGELIVLDNLFR